MAKKWQCLTDHGNEQVIVKKYDRVHPFLNGTPYIDILDYNEENLDLSSVPDGFFVNGRP